MNYKQARDIATRVYKALEPFCQKIDFAGDIAKESKEVVTIVIFCQPRKQSIDVKYSPFELEVRKSFIQIDGELKHGWGKYVILDQDCGEVFLEIRIPHENVYYYRLVTYEAPDSFVKKLDDAREDIGLTPQSSEWHFFNSLGMKWIPVKERV